jgi:hypothetical protein
MDWLCFLKAETEEGYFPHPLRTSPLRDIIQAMILFPCGSGTAGRELLAELTRKQAGASL